jgi:hypothetical protein
VWRRTASSRCINLGCKSMADLLCLAPTGNRYPAVPSAQKVGRCCG